MTLHVAVDMDDVLLDFSGGVRRIVAKEYGIIIPDGDPWDPAIKDLPPYGKGGFWGWLRERDWLWAKFPALDGAIGSLRVMRQEGILTELVTSKPDWAIPQVYAWLGKWRPPVSKVTIVGKDDNKAEFTNADVLIDDKPSNIEDFAGTGRLALWFNRFGLSVDKVQGTGMWWPSRLGPVTRGGLIQNMKGDAVGDAAGTWRRTLARVLEEAKASE